MSAASSPRLRSVPLTRDARAPRTRDTGVVAQVRAALSPKNRLPTALGALLGGGVPVATYCLAHGEVSPDRPLYLQLPAWLVLGGLLFSALTVYRWGAEAFGSPVKALGFAVLLEGVLVGSTTPWLSAGALCYLVGINAVSTGCVLSLRRTP